MSAHLCVIKHSKTDRFKSNCKYIMHLCLKQTNSHDSLNLVLETDHVLCCKYQLSEVSDPEETPTVYTAAAPVVHGSPICLPY